ncbi:hypothetical protein OAQ99_00665 [Candidatus Kapabacteria bacterium]|nr:hypothetical protein [Candidatus Kapabacteria bacterium]
MNKTLYNILVLLFLSGCSNNFNFDNYLRKNGCDSVSISNMADSFLYFNGENSSSYNIIIQNNFDSIELTIER